MNLNVKLIKPWPHAVVGVEEGEGVGASVGADAGAILDELTDFHIFAVGVNVKLMEPRLMAAGVGENLKQICHDCSKNS